MSEPLRRSDHDDYAEAELKRWPGVTWERHHRSKHMALVLTFQGVSRFVTYPLTTSDSVRGPLNHVATIRRTLREMGATRLEVVKGQGQAKRRARKAASDEPIKLDPREKTRLDQNPFDALAGFQCAEPVAPAEPPPQTPPPSLWRRILKAILGGKA